MVRSNICQAGFVILLVLVTLCRSTAWAQENVREINKPGSFNKFLTPTTMDRWTFTGLKGESVLVDVRTKEFDAVVTLLRADDNSKETVLETVDDEGSNCRLVVRLPADGSYKIGVQGFEQKGGGNYSLSMQKFLAKEIAIDQIVTGEFDREGNAYFYFASEGEQCITVDTLRDKYRVNFVLLDNKGIEMTPWNSMYILEEPGTKKRNEYRLKVKGEGSEPFQIQIKSAVRANLEKDLELKLEPYQAAVLDVMGSTGAFRLIDVSSNKKLDSRFVFASKRKPNESPLDKAPDQPELTSLKEFGKGKRKSYAVILGRNGKYQLQVFAWEATKITVKAIDPREKLQVGAVSNHELKLGDYRFFQFQPKAGQTSTVRVASSDFDTQVQLFDERGSSLATNDDYNDELNSQLRYTSYSDSPLIVAVSSVGNGGGGKFELGVQADTPKSIASGETKTQRMNDTGSELWQFRAKEDEHIILYCKTQSPASLTIKNGEGIVVGRKGSEDDSGGTVMLFKFPKEGDYSIEASLEVGAEYALQIINAS